MDEASENNAKITDESWIESEDQSSEGVSAERDIRAERDIAGRDIVTSSTQIGFSERSVLRLVVIVGVLVFITAACFFSGGIAIGAGVFAAFNRQVDSNLLAAQSVQATLNQISELPEGQQFAAEFTETQLSSYFRFILAPDLGIEDGQLRVISSDKIAIRGEPDQLGNRPFTATFDIQTNTPKPLRLSSAAVQVVDVGSRSFGWVVVPTPLLQGVENDINERIAGDFLITDVRELPGPKKGLQILGIAGIR